MIICYVFYCNHNLIIQYSNRHLFLYYHLEFSYHNMCLLSGYQAIRYQQNLISVPLGLNQSTSLFFELPILRSSYLHDTNLVHPYQRTVNWVLHPWAEKNWRILDWVSDFLNLYLKKTERNVHSKIKMTNYEKIQSKSDQNMAPTVPTLTYRYYLGRYLLSLNW